MKKIISMILTLSMVLGLVAALGLTVSAAPEGTAINSAADFAAMEDDGIYYLASDITLEASYEDIFSGTFDGNGKTVTIKTNAMFAWVDSAKISNLTVKGDLNPGSELGVPVGNEDFFAAVAVVADGASVFRNITSDVNFTSTGEKSRWGAIAATSSSGHELLIENCVANGNVTAVNYAGGVYGWSAQLGDSVIRNCINNGNITLSNGYGAGICCRLAGSGEGSLIIESCINNGNISVNHDQGAGIMAYANTAIVTIKGCINNGNIDNVKSISAGILGNVSAPGVENHVWTVSGCTNNGTITGVKNTAGIVGSFQDPKIDNGRYYATGNLNNGAVTCSGGGNAGGIVGYAYGRGKEETGAFATVVGNVNTGVITNTGNFVSQILSYTNQPCTVITDNLGIGKVVGDDENKTTFIGFSNADFSRYTIKNNYLIVDDGLIKYSYTATAGSESFITAFADRPADSVYSITASEIADSLAKVNTALGTTAFELKDGKVTMVCQHGFYTTPTTPAKDPTCTEAGSTASYKCSLCGTDVAGTAIDALGHDLKKGECQRCDYIDHTQTTPPKQETTKAPEAEQTPAPETGAQTPAGDETTKAPEKSGCGGFAAGAVAIVAILGTAVAFKKKED